MTSLSRSEFKKLHRQIRINWANDASKKLEELGFEPQHTSINDRALWSPLKIPCFFKSFFFVYATNGNGGVYTKLYWFARYRNLDVCKELSEDYFSEVDSFPVCEGETTL